MKHIRYYYFLLIFLFIFSNNTFGQVTDHPPVFTGGHSQVVGICENNPSVSIDTILAVNDSDIGDTETWSVLSGPSNGTLAASFTTLSTGTTLTPSGLSYVANTGYSGIDSFSVSIFDGFVADTTTVYITITPPPSISAITGVFGACAGAATTLADTAAAGTWSSANTSIATVDPASGTVTGVAGGTTTISYSLTGTCGAADTSVTFTVNTAPPPIPFGITGLHAACIGGIVNLHDATTGGKWLSGNAAIATVDSLLGQVTGVSAGLAAITYAEANFCASYYRTITFEVDPLPPPVTGSLALCTGVSSTLHDSLTGGSWTSSASSIANIGLYTSVVTGVSSGTAVITYTVGTASCKTTSVVTVNVTPSAFSVTGGGAYCSGGTGVHIGLSGSSAGIQYQLYRIGSPVGSPLAGTGAALDFGLQTVVGSYTIEGTDTLSGCGKNMTGIVSVAINALPNTFTVTGGGNYCAGGTGYHIFLIASQAGIHYQLFNGATPVGSYISGTGGTLDFGLYAAPGTYTVVATSPLTGCSRTMTGSATIAVSPHPVPFAIIGGGNYCEGGAGVHIGLDSSTLGVNYQLRNGGASFGSPVSGTGVPLDLGLVVPPGVYTVLATNAATGCTTLMPGSTTVVINPLPATYPVTGGGGYCIGGSGRNITLPGSQTGTSYQLYYGPATAGIPVSGTGAALDFGLQTAVGGYTVIATNVATSCTSLMLDSTSIMIDSLPTAYNVTGGGSYCAGDYGVYIDLSGSDVDVDYQLYNAATVSGIPLSGTGGPLDMALETAAGTYTVVATDVITGCTGNMTGTATVIQNPLPGAITGVDSVYVGETTTLSDVTPGGTWVSQNTSLATVSSTGIVYGDSVGRDTILYTLPTGCSAKVEVTVNYAPLDTTSHVLVGHFTNGSAGITVFPNPSAGNLNIKWTNQVPGTAEIIVTNIVGQVVYRQPASISAPSGQTQIDPGLNDGNYLLTIRSETSFYTSQLLIRH